MCLLRLFLDRRRRLLLRRKPQALPLRMVARASQGGRAVSRICSRAATRPGGCRVPEVAVRVSTRRAGVVPV